MLDMDPETESEQESTNSRCKNTFWRWRAVVCVGSVLTLSDGAWCACEPIFAFRHNHRTVAKGFDVLRLVLGSVMINCSFIMIIVLFSRLEVILIENKLNLP